MEKKINIVEAEKIKDDFHKEYNEIFNSLYASFPNFLLTVAVFFLTVHQTFNKDIIESPFLSLSVLTLFLVIFLIFFQAYYYNSLVKIISYGDKIFTISEKIRQYEGANSRYSEKENQEVKNIFFDNSVNITTLYKIFLWIVFLSYALTVFILSYCFIYSVLFVGFLFFAILLELPGYVLVRLKKLIEKSIKNKSKNL